EEALPVWGKLPLRLKRERSQRPVKEGAAELTTGHIPVLRDESINCLLGGPDGRDGFYADGTFGRGGHSTEILRRLSGTGRLWSFDVDPNAIAVGRKLEELDERFSMIHRPFADVHKSLPDGLELSGMLLDIGFSSPQVDDGGRGWSCYQDGPLDLRMNFKAGIPAWKWLQTATPAELAWVVYENGEDDDPILCHRIAEAALERQRRCGPYTSTLELSTCIQEVKRGLDDRRQHPAKLAFQGIRNFINQEMQQLADAMAAQFQRLKYGGRAVVITFKPREEQVLENWLRHNEDGWASPLASQVSPDRLGELFPLLSSVQPYAARRLMAPIRPSAEEVRRNSRSEFPTLEFRVWGCRGLGV
ncbi:rsmH, partial [Symbiodinium microadriaticum]